MEILNTILDLVLIGGLGALRTLIRKEIRDGMQPLVERVRKLELVHGSPDDAMGLEALGAAE